MSTEYDGHSRTNLDTETGIRYGIMSQHSLPYLDDSIEPVYCAGCPHCGHGVSDDIDTPVACHNCGETIEDGDQWADEPDCWNLTDPEYAGYLAHDGDVWLCRSPFYTHASFCSPCAPGAGHLDNPCSTGPKVYCFGHDMFETTAAPYPVFSVDTGKPVEGEPDR